MYLLTVKLPWRRLFDRPKFCNEAVKLILNKRDMLISHQGHFLSIIKIDNDVWIGANYTILENVHIDTGCVVGAGTFVTRDLPAYSIAVGALDMVN